jgi:hypothetical protein
MFCITDFSEFLRMKSPIVGYRVTKNKGQNIIEFEGDLNKMLNYLISSAIDYHLYRLQNLIKTLQNTVALERAQTISDKVTVQTETEKQGTTDNTHYRSRLSETGLVMHISRTTNQTTTVNSDYLKPQESQYENSEMDTRDAAPEPDATPEPTYRIPTYINTIGRRRHNMTRTNPYTNWPNNVN